MTIHSFPAKPPRLPENGGGSEPPMEARIARLEASVEHIERDISDIKIDLRELRTDNKTLITKLDSRVIWLLSVIAASAIGLASLMAKGFHWF